MSSRLEAMSESTPRVFPKRAARVVPTMTAILTLAMAGLSWLWFDTKAT